MGNISVSGATQGSDERRRVVTCDLSFLVVERAEIVVQVAAADSAGQVIDERFDVTTDGEPPVSLEELRNFSGERMHVICSDPGRLSVSYRSEISVPTAHSLMPDSG